MFRQNTSHLNVSRRILCIFVLTAAAILVLIFRLGWIQFVRAEELQQKAWEQWNRSIPTRSPRGSIYDCNGHLLAGSATVETVVAVPPQITEPLFTARALAPVLEMSVERIFELITQERAAVYVKRKITGETAKEIRLLNLPGITFTHETKRFYPNGNLLSQLLGFVGTDQGWSGLEIYYEEYLKGRDGQIFFPTDNKGREVAGVRRYNPPKEGLDLYLTIDETIQYILERELGKAMVEYDPDRIMGLAVNPQTGAFLAAAAKPDFDPNDYNHYSKEYWRLYPVTDTFEPGSTFKLVTLSAAVEENLYNEQEHFFCSGSTTVAGHTIRCWTSGQGGHGSISYLEAVLGSCNPAFIQLGERLGPEKMFEYVRAFGFGAKTGLNFPGEGAGLIFRPEQIGPLELATSSFGQGVSVTPLQQVMAAATIANGGNLLRPYLVQEIKDPDGKVVERGSPEIIRRVISPDTAQRVTSLMEGVVKEGSGINAAIEGYRIAGKTGTAQKVGPGGAYKPGEYILSFIGFAPVEDPQVLLYIAVDGAKRGAQWGSQISAPIFQAIMKDVLSYLEIPPAEMPVVPEVQSVEVPALKGLTIDQAGALLDTQGLLLKLVGEKGLIKDQTPKPGARVPIQTKIIVYLEDLWDEENPAKVVVPDLQGMTIKEVGEILNYLDLQAVPAGSGLAVQQEPAAGTVVNKNSSVQVNFSSPLNENNS